MKPDTEEVKRGGCSNMLFRIIRGLVAARKYSHIPDGGSERTNQITAPRLPAVKCLIKGACCSFEEESLRKRPPSTKPTLCSHD